MSDKTMFTLNYAVASEDIPDEVAMTIYRLTQEALTNCVRHADAMHVVISVENIDGRLRWSVTDDGVGVGDVAGSVEVGNGLAGMRERVWALGSDLELGIARADPTHPGLQLAASFPARA